MKIPLYQIDAFTNRVFGGNPAAVCPLEQWRDAELLQHIAAENNLAETAFFVKKGDDFELRWFTPEVEVDLCGHATLASAYVIFNHLDYTGNSIRFHTKSGVLTVSRDTEFLILDFPGAKPGGTEIPGLTEALGIQPLEVLEAKRHVVALLENEEDVLRANPDMALLKKIDRFGFIVTAQGKKSDFVSRFFAPGAGIPEDPATGAAHCVLTPYWAEKLGKKSLHAIQLSKRRGELFCEEQGNRVLLRGKAVPFCKGTIEIE